MARTESKWQKKGTFLIPNDDVPIVLRNDYLNFGGITAGDLGFGIRNNAGTIQFKNSAGAWTDMGGGGSLPDQTGNNGRFLTTNGTVSSWATVSGGGDLLASNNLSDVADVGTARTNLGLGTAAESATGDFATAAQGTLAASASQPGHTHVAANITDFAAAVAVTASVTANTAKNTYPSGDATKVGHITVTQAVNLDTMESDIAALEQAVVLKGLWDASAGTFPGGGTAQAGFSYIVSVGGTVDSVVFTANDRLVAILDNASTTTYASNWHKLDYTDAVLSVAGRTGAVVLVKGDVGLGSVDDTADTAKPVSTAQQTALNLKANLASPTFTGTPTLPTGTIGTTQTAGNSTTALATTAFATTALNLKANLASPTFTGTPTLPTGTIATTQTAGNSTTAIATTAFVTTADNLKANLASPTFTGTPTMPTGTIATTQTAGNSTTAIATTAFATTALNLKANLASPTFTGTLSAATISTSDAITSLDVITGDSLRILEGAAPSLEAGYGKLYVKSTDSKLYFKDDAGTEYALTNTASGVGITWSESTGTTQAAVVNNGYIVNNASQVVVTIPDTAAVGDIVRVVGKGAGGWRVSQNASESIRFGGSVTTTGVGGYLSSVNQYDSVELVCITANTTWSVMSSSGNITIV